jgi:hypothetical protein
MLINTVFGVELVQFVLYALKGTIRSVCPKSLQNICFSSQIEHVL